MQLASNNNIVVHKTPIKRIHIDIATNVVVNEIAETKNKIVDGIIIIIAYPSFNLEVPSDFISNDVHENPEEEMKADKVSI